MDHSYSAHLPELITFTVTAYICMQVAHKKTGGVQHVEQVDSTNVISLPPPPC